MPRVDQQVPATQAADAEWRTQLLRSQYAAIVENALYQAAHLSKHANIATAPRHEPVSHFREIAEAAVALVCNEDLRIAADYYAAACICGEQNIDLETLPLKKRVRLAMEFRIGLNGFLRILRGLYPTGMTKYAQLAADDRRQMAAIRSGQIVPRQVGA